MSISRDGGATWTSVGEAGPNVTFYSVPGLQPNTRNRYRVRAENAEGFSDYTNTVEVLTRRS